MDNNKLTKEDIILFGYVVVACMSALVLTYIISTSL